MVNVTEMSKAVSAAMIQRQMCKDKYVNAQSEQPMRLQTLAFRLTHFPTQIFMLQPQVSNDRYQTAVHTSSRRSTCNKCIFSLSSVF